MKIKLEEVKEQEMTEVIVRYPFWDYTLDRLLKKIKCVSMKLLGYDDKGKFKIPLEDIFYIESVDKKTFLYCKEKVLRSDLKLYEALKEVDAYNFIRISKSCIVNASELDADKMLINSRLEATLSNGEKLTVSRKYIPEIKHHFMTLGGCQ